MNTYTLEIAGLRILLDAETPMIFHRYLQPFLVQDEGRTPDLTVRLSFCTPPQPEGELLFSDGRLAEYGKGDAVQRRFLMWSRDPASPDNPVLVFDEKNKATLCCPSARAQVFTEACELTPLLALERLFAQNDRLILHSAAVLHKDCAVLFSAPSGVGKSTQANLWVQCFGAEILNGDRCVIEQTEAGFTAHGSPYAGSSEICKRKSAPLKGIFVLRQAPENSVRALPPAEAFRRLFPQTVVNAWNAEQMQRVTDLLASVTTTLPVYELACRPDLAAAELAESILWNSKP